MRLASALVRAAFLWSIPMLLAVLLWAPITGLARGGPAQLLLALLVVGVFGGALVTGAARMTVELVSGRYDEQRASARAALPPRPALPFRQHLIRVALFVTSSLLTFLVLELVFRIFFPQPLYAVAFAPWGFWHIPNVCLVHGAEPKYEGKILRGTEFVTHICYNSQGMRERELPFAKPPGTKRVLVLGDSYGEGMEVEFEQTIGQVLERLLNERLSSLGGGQKPRPPEIAPAVAPLSDPPVWAVTRAVLRRLHDAAASDGARLLVANVHYAGPEFERRRAFFDEAGIVWVDLTLADPAAERPLYHYRFDGHWNQAGHARAARLVADRILDAGMLAGGATERVEVLNASMSAFSTCKELAVYERIGRRYAPDLVLVVYTGADERNLADLDVCRRDANGGVTLGERRYGSVQYALRSVRSLLRAHSHFGAWVLDRLDAIPFLNDLRVQLIQGEEQVRFIEEGR